MKHSRAYVKHISSQPYSKLRTSSERRIHTNDRANRWKTRKAITDTATLSVIGGSTIVRAHPTFGNALRHLFHKTVKDIKRK